MAATDRLFFALVPPATTAAEIYALQQDLRVRHGLWGRATAMDRLQVTLWHLGDHVGLPGDVVARACDAAGRVSVPPVEVTLGRALSIEGRARHRPFVLKDAQAGSGVDALQRQLGVAMKACGLGRFVRPGAPHMTLLYDTAEVNELPVAPVSWRADAFVLIHSRLGQTRQVQLGAWALKESSVKQSALAAAI